jgi:CheY-like chemotaxis protein
MFQTEWPVLLVDDDPDVLAVSKLAMKSFEIDGVPIKLFTATSKDEAVKLLSGPLGSTALPYVSVAFIDVVMETDHAGLELCRYIRETQMNRMTTIYVRTGQPGLAPERDVIDRYDINGYFSKAETTEDKLYSLVKAGIRQFDFASMTVLEFQVIGSAMAAGGSVEGLQRAIGEVLGQIPRDPTGAPTRLGGYDIRVSKGTACWAATTIPRKLWRNEIVSFGSGSSRSTSRGTATSRTGTTISSRRRRPTRTETCGISAAFRVSPARATP